MRVENTCHLQTSGIVRYQMIYKYRLCKLGTVRVQLRFLEVLHILYSILKKNFEPSGDEKRFLGTLRGGGGVVSRKVF